MMSVGEGSAAGAAAVDPLRKSGLAASEICRRDLGSGHQLVPALERSRAAEVMVELPLRGKLCEGGCGHAALRGQTGRQAGRTVHGTARVAAASCDTHRSPCPR